MNIEGVAQFAFLGKHTNAFAPAFVLAKNGCQAINMSSDMGFLLHPYEGAAALDFGNEFRLKLSYTANCEFGKGDLFRTPGAIVRAEDTDYLVAVGSGWRDPFYYNLQTGDRKSEPGGARVAFASWALFTEDDQKSPLFEMNARKPA
jgi:hypothetical protein